MRRFGMAARDATRLRHLAAETLAAADRMTDPSCRRGMIKIAAAYERLAEFVDEAARSPLTDDDQPQRDPTDAGAHSSRQRIQRKPPVV
jgi:hypothetical protein